MMVDVKKRRVGKFSISRMTIDCRPEVAKMVLSRCVILRAENILHSDVIEYIAESDLFDEINQGDLIPEYDFFMVRGTTHDSLFFRKEKEANGRHIGFISIKEKEEKQMLSSTEDHSRVGKKPKYKPTDKIISRKSIYVALEPLFENCEEAEDQWEKFDNHFRHFYGWSDVISTDPHNELMSHYLPKNPQAVDWAVENGFLQVEDDREYSSGDLFIAVSSDGLSNCTALLFQDDKDRYFMIDIDSGTHFSRDLKKKVAKDRGEKVGIDFVNSLSRSFTFKYLGRTENGFIDRSKRSDS